MSKKNKIVFLTGTRADFGKLKSLIQILQNHERFEAHIFVTGMHMQKQYGYTLVEVEKSGFKNISTFKNQTDEATMDLTLAKTIEGFSSYIHKLKPDLIVIHGDRVEALAGSIVGSLNNILVAHIEGGELSGTIDELIRHSVSKLSHIHFVANKEAKKRLLQMGELPESIFTIGSPDVDIMFSDKLPSIAEALNYYEIPFSNYALVLFHPVTTEIDKIKDYTRNFINAVILSKKNYVIIYPNNDLGSKTIIEEYIKIENKSTIKIFPSLRFEYFLTLLKNSEFIIGNSSAGIREAPYYNVPTINIGSRQNNRSNNNSILNVDYEEASIVNAIELVKSDKTKTQKDVSFGIGNSSNEFLKSLESKELWKINHQKQFRDILLFK